MLLPFKLVKGTDSNMEAFETAVSEALMQGYEISSDLVVQSITENGETRLILLQPMVFDEAIEFEEDEIDEFEEESETEQEELA